MISKEHVPSAKEISTQIKEKRRQARKKLVKRIVMSIVFLILLVITSYGLYILDQSQVLRIQHILISQVRISNERNVWDNLPFQQYDRIWTNLPLWTEIEVEDEAIESITFSINNRNVIVVVHEYKPLALTSTHILLSNGVYYPQTSANKANLGYLPHIEGFNESELSVKLANALLGLEDFVLNLMANIKQNPLSYDEAMMIVTLDNGMSIHSDLRSLYLLNQLPLFIDLINENNNCLYLDSVTSTARAAPCP
jgi:cell division septal protein FtsQ